ncbi:terpenoid synthase [Exidia glandulosa HHB12029]|uniref:Terpene synthase n=1 Tax=Exidia glandulosa HHB12029 TaxID=1314781 RepID=A0A165EM85_EXIGL|nr:terpenoid synthase [Exidia glandulosa HHB12029]
MDTWPWPRKLNVHYEEVKRESDSWFFAFRPFTPKSLAAFERCDFAKLTCLGGNSASKEEIRVGCDLMNLFFLIDEYTDRQPREVVQTTCDIVLDALNNPEKPRPEGEILVGSVAQLFWQNAIKHSTPEARRFFMKTFSLYLDSVIVQADDRDKNYVRTIQEYIDMRRDNIGLRPSLFIGTMKLDMPAPAWDHQYLLDLENIISDFNLFDNDMVSFNKEQASDDAECNIVTVIMHSLKTDYLGAIEWIVREHKRLQRVFLELAVSLPQRLRDDGVEVTPRTEEQLGLYIEHMAQWPRANKQWSFESGRYFGDKGLEIQETRLVRKLPKRTSDDNKLGLPQANVIITIPTVEVC